MTTPVTSLDEHERALDYLYGFLDGEEKTRFEAHLATCARCQAELEANGHVRAAAKSVLAPVEPSERLTGALHAQLMHEAAQRSSRGGKVLPLVRRLVRHPAYAAAAGLLIVGGAIGVQWSRGKLTMPPPPAHEETAAAPSPPAGAPEPAATAPGSVDKGLAAPAKSAPVMSPAPAGAASVAKVQPKPMRAGKDEVALPMDKSAEEGGLLRGAKGKGYADDLVLGSLDEEKPRAYGKADRPPPPPSFKKQSSASSFDTAERDAEPQRAIATNEPSSGGNAQNGLAARTPVPQAPRDEPAPKSPAHYAQPSSAPVVAAPAEAELADGTQQHAAGAYGARQNNDDRVEVDRRQAETFAQQNRCDEAASLYGSLARRAPQRLTSTDKLAYARCLRVLGRIEPAQTELDQLANTATPAPAIAAEQQALDGERRKQNTLRAKAKRALDDQTPQPAAAKPAE